MDPEGLPGIYMARVVATLEGFSTESSLDASGSETYVVKEKSPLVKFLLSPLRNLLKNRSKIMLFVALVSLKSVRVNACQDY